MTRKLKKDKDRPEIEKNHLKCYPFIFYKEGKNQTFIQSYRPFASIFSHFIGSCENFQKIQLFSLQVKKSLL